jgi:hypothetical protein
MKDMKRMKMQKKSYSAISPFMSFMLFMVEKKGGCLVGSHPGGKQRKIPLMPGALVVLLQATRAANSQPALLFPPPFALIVLPYYTQKVVQKAQGWHHRLCSLMPPALKPRVT